LLTEWARNGVRVIGWKIHSRAGTLIGGGSLFDAPPLLAVSDALAMGPMADAIALIARAGQTPMQALKQAKQKLDAHKLKCLGVILNGVDLLEQDGYYAKQYYSYSRSE
jgi:Mrp family chromosome partitioning ATPase